MERTKRRRLTADAWRAVLARFAESGLTVQAFCQREVINVTSFYRWRSMLSGAQDELSSPVAKRTTGFVDLGTLSASGSRFELRLDLGDGVLLHLVRG
jgi:chemotaxis methyl-accepting protein methylase